MSSDAVSINFSGFESHFSNALDDSLLFNLFTDVTLVSDDDKYYRAHKIVLSSCSSLFSRLLETHQTNDRECFINFPGLQHQELKAMLDFMYLGRVFVPHVRFDEFMQFMRQIEVKGLEKYKEAFETEQNYYLSTIKIRIGEQKIEFLNTGNTGNCLFFL